MATENQFQFSSCSPEEQLLLCRKWMEEDRFDYTLQPKVNLLTGEIVGAEVFVRVALENGDEVSFPECAEAVERAGISAELDLRILRKVCADIAARLKREKTVVKTTLNLSESQLREDCAAERIHAVVCEYAVPESYLEFELSEKLYFGDETRARVLMDALCAKGYSIAVDGFGIGYTGVNLGRGATFDTFKLDKSFLSQAPNTNCLLLLSDIVRSVKRMNNIVVCEGVENEDDCLTLLANNCNYAQGPYFLKPVPKDDFYRVFSSMNGYFKTPYLQKDRFLSAPDPETGSVKQKKSFRTHLAFLFGIFLLGFLILIPQVVFLQSKGLLNRLQNILVSLDETVRDAVGRELFQTSLIVTLILALSVLCGGTVLFLLVRKYDRKRQKYESRWQIVEQLSDTAFFTYTVSTDTLELTENATQLFRAKGLVLKNYLSDLSKTSAAYSHDYHLIEQALHPDSGAATEEIRVRLKHPSAERYCWYLLKLHYIWKDTRLVRVVGRIQDISRIQQIEADLRAKIQYDGMTKLFSKAYFEHRVSLGMRKESSGILSVLDIDSFKSINDQFGHAVGDRAIKLVAGCISECFPHVLTGRIGGDEFAIYLPGTEDSEAVNEKMRELQDFISEEGSKTGLPEIRLSVGIACFPQDGETYSQLFSRADQCMYHVKNSGGGALYI